jgi:hypothetical protein
MVTSTELVLAMAAPDTNPTFPAASPASTCNASA